MSLLGLVAILSGGPALGGVLRQGRCHMDYCSWFSIEELDLVASNSAGALFKVTSRGWTSRHPGGSYARKARRQGGESSTSYAFCSKARPSLVERSGSKWLATTLSFEPDGISGATETADIFYFAVCHQLTIEPGRLYDLVPRLARHFGYHTDQREPGQVEIAAPEDVLGRP